MEPYNTSSESGHPTNYKKNNGRVLGGLFIVAVGVILLARQAGVLFPGWLFSFEMLLIALGVYLGIRHSFRGFGWLIPILIGAVLLVDDIYPYFEIRPYIWPLAIIIVGLFIMFRGAGKKKGWKRFESVNAETTSDDYIDSSVVFGGIKKSVISKNFRGGEAVTVFGGTEINLTQADFNGTINLELTQVFGGTKLIVPPHWTVLSKDIVAIFGGVDDKRPMMTGGVANDGDRVLVLTGTCIFGGIDIKSF